MNKFFTLTFTLLLGLSSAFAQSMYHIGFNEDGVSIPDTVDMGDEYLIDFVLENKGTESITNTVNLYLATYDEVEGLSAQRWIGGFSNIDLSPGETFTPPNPEDIYDIATQANYYGPGDNIVVIWPVIDNGEAQNSENFYNDLYVNDPNTTISEVEKMRFEVMSSEGFIRVQSKASVSRLVVFDLKGKMIYNGVEKEIPTTALSKGMYIVQLNFEDGLSQSRKVLVK